MLTKSTSYYARVGDRVVYKEVQVKYGKLHDCGPKWEKALFDVTSWRFFKHDEFKSHAKRPDLFLAYVLAHDSGYKGDIFLFPISAFHDLLCQAHVSGEKRMAWISRSVKEPNRWFFRLKRGFDQINEETCAEVTQYRRNFKVLEK